MSGHRKSSPDSIQKRISKFYVSHLPERCSGNDLAGFVREVGIIYDIYIARKKDKEGNRFGFISMLDVKDREETCKRLSAIRMGDVRLRFNVARFVLEEGEIGGDREDPGRRFRDSGKGNGDGKEGGTDHGNPNPWRIGCRTFKDTLLGEKKACQEVRSITINNNVKAFDRVHGKAVIVRMADLKALRELKCTMKELGMPEGLVQYLGGVSAMISYEERLSAVQALEIGKLAVHKFSQISLWEGQSVGFERLAWLKVHGIPLHILTNGVIDSVGGLFGKIVHKAERAESDRDLSFEFVGVLVGEGRRIADEVMVCWNDRKFRVWVLEEMGDWVPEFDEPSVDFGVRPEVDMVGSEFRPEEEAGVDRGGYKSSVVNDGVNSVVNEEGFKAGSFGNSNKGDPIFSMGNSNDKKRKKYKKKSRSGRPSMEMSSSLERPNNGKRARCSPDVFGLNPFIFGDAAAGSLDAERDRQDGVVFEEASGDGAVMPDLNSSPNASIEFSQIASGGGGCLDSRVRVGRGSEIEATMEMGGKLGIDLVNFERLISETISQEGLQRGKL